MSNRLYLGRDIQAFSKADEDKPVTHVIVYYGYDEDGNALYKEAVASPDNGRTIEKTLNVITDPAQVQAIANSLLTSYASPHQGFVANGSELDPAAELGDAVLVNGTYSSLGAVDTDFNQGMFADVESQSVAEEDEFFYEAPQARELKRTEKEAKVASIKIDGMEIELQGKVNFTDLEESGRTTINGDNITTGVIQSTNGNVKFDLENGTLEVKSGQTYSNISGAIKNSVTEYAQNESPTTAPTSGWSTTIPQWESGKYIWSRTTITLMNGSSTTSDPVCLTGTKGDDGTSITILGSYNSYAELIAAHPTGNAGDGYIVQGDLYVWTGAWQNVGRIQGPQGIQGNPGATGATGNGISSIVKTSTSGLNDTYTITYTNGTTTTYVVKNGAKGDKGDTGEKGDTGATGSAGQNGVSVTAIVNQYYLSTSSASPQGGSWQNSVPTYESGKYIWIRQAVTWSTGTTTNTNAVLDNALNGFGLTLDGIVAFKNNAETGGATVINGASIQTGTMNADRIKGGTLELGGLNNTSGVEHILDENGNVIGRWDKDGVLITDDSNTESFLSDGKFRLLRKNGNSNLGVFMGAGQLYNVYFPGQYPNETIAYILVKGDSSVWGNTEIVGGSIRMEQGGDSVKLDVATATPNYAITRTGGRTTSFTHSLHTWGRMATLTIHLSNGANTGSGATDVVFSGTLSNYKPVSVVTAAANWFEWQIVGKIDTSGNITISMLNKGAVVAYRGDVDISFTYLF